MFKAIFLILLVIDLYFIAITISIMPNKKVTWAEFGKELKKRWTW